MAAHNMGADDAEALSLHEMEAGLGSSRCHLIMPMEEERPISIKQSISKSVRTSVRKMTYYCSFVTRPIKLVLLKFKLLIIIALYSVFGAWLFTTLEVPHDLEQKEEAYHGRLIARDVMILNLRAIHLDNREDREQRWKDAVMKFEQDVGLDEPSLDTAWTFWMAFLYAGTIYTTIGYGNIACQTRAGQVATLIYAFVGIPIMLVLLNGLGDFLLNVVKLSAGTSSDLMLFLGVRWGFVALEEGSKKWKRYLAFCKKLNRFRLISKTISVRTIASEEEDEDVEVKPDPPVFSAIFLTFGWIFLSAGVFCLWEDWTYFTSIYFFFISCSTIGLGDVTPAHPQYMIFAFGVVMIGLAMVTVCINVVQEKLELMYMALLNKLLEDYLAAVESGDPNAAAGMMSGFQGKAKFLMPLISKSQGAKVMNQFKDDCVAKGIDPPPVLTDIDPNTGMPAFASANKDDFNDFIEQAEERQAEDRKVQEERAQSRTSTKLDVPVITVEHIHVGVQASAPPVFQPKPEGITFGSQTTSSGGDRSFGAQFSPPSLDGETQTLEFPSCNEGIQAWSCCEDASIQYDLAIVMDSSTQYDLPEPRKSSAVSTVAERNTVGIQPEVSMFTVPEDSEDEISTDDLLSEEDEDIVEPLEEKLASLTLPSIQRLRKSMSEESQDTVISVSPSMSPNTRRRKLEERKKKKRSQKLEGLRFMKNSGDQTTFDSTHMETQTEIEPVTVAVQCNAETAELSVQHDLDMRAKRCQTKLTCIPAEKQCNNIVRRLSSSRGSQRPLRKQLSNLSNTSERNSASSLEALPVNHSLHSIDESGAQELSESPEWPDIAEEVVLNVSLVSKPVNEEGEYVEEQPKFSLYDQSIGDDEVTGAEIGDDVFDSEDDLDEEMEHFVLNGWTQTEDRSVDSLEVQVNPNDLNILFGAMCQTELSSFRVPTQTSVDQPQGHAEQQTESMQASTEDQEHVKFLTDSGCQPMFESSSISCQTELQKSTSIVQISPDTEDVTAQTDEKKCLDCLSQTEPCGTPVTTQTELVTVDNETETERQEFAEEETQVEVVTAEFGVLVVSENQDNEAQTDEYWKTGEHIQIQTEAVMVEATTETDHDTKEEEAQTSTVMMSSAVQWELKNVEESSQTQLDTSEFASQADWTGVDCDTQTDEKPKKAKRRESTMAQTQAGSKAAGASTVTPQAMSGVDATLPMTSTQVQSDVSMFVVPHSDRSRLEVAHDVRFNVDSATWMEEKRQKSIGTQKVPAVESSSVQCRPLVATSQTQYSNSFASDQISQTELSTKNKRSQGMDATATTDSSGCSTEWSKSEAEVQFPPPAVLWSDFDPIIEDFNDEDEQETEEGTEPERKHSIPSVDAECSAAPEMEDSEAQAVVQMETKACGFEGNDDWVKVYVQELDEERRNRMFDIGIQTGVLARVQHMYGKKDVPVVEGGGEPANVDILKVSLRKTESEEQLSKKKDGSDESLSRAGSVRSVTESLEENTTTWPTTSKAPTEVRRATSMRKPKKKEKPKGEVADAVRRFEKRKSAADPKRQRSSSSER